MKNGATLLGGQDFVEIIRRELKDDEACVDKIANLARESSVSESYIRGIINGKHPNPSNIVTRLLLYALGHSIPNPEYDVIPRLKRRGVLQDDKTKRKVSSCFTP